MRWFILAILFIARTCMALEFQMLGALMPFARLDLNSDYAAMGQLMGLFMLPGIVMALPAGMLSSRFGLKRLAVFSLLLLAGGSALFSVSHDYGTALAGRLLGGAGNAVLSVLVSAMVAEWFRDRELSTALSIVFISWQFGLAVALALFPAIAEAASWRWACHLTTLVCLTVAVLVGLTYRSPSGTVVARRSMPSLRLILRRQSILPTLAGIIWTAYNVGQVIFLTYAPALLASTGMSVTEASGTVSLTVWVTMATMPLGGLLTDRFRWPLLPVAVGSLGAAAAGTAFSLGAPPVASCIIAGLFLGLPAGGILALPARHADPADTAWSLGWFMTVFYILMTLIQMMAGLIRDRTGSDLVTVEFGCALLALVAIGLIPFELARRALRPSPAIAA
ncbi:MFS transporter [Azospirillum sp. B2RO_4]|uniref:MFS transporter n=1 Tax=Azospirillum sp. B2RO_4 TaxID=3027796 RepID=UPI003DA87713